jgi:hypothetical protein
MPTITLKTPPPGNKNTILTPDGVPNLPFLGIAVGPPRGGKTYSTAVLAEALMRGGYLNRLFVVSPTWHTSSHLWKWAGALDADCYLDGSQALSAIEDVIRKVSVQNTLWEAYQQRLEVSRKARQGLPLSIQEEMILSRPWSGPVPTKRPSALLIFDDLMGSRLLLNNRTLVQKCISYRHLAGGAGLSMLFLVQSLRSGLNRCIRHNSNWVMLWKSMDKSLIDDMAKELSGKVTRDQFQSLFFESTKAPYSFLVIDQTHEDPNRLFRQGFEGPWLDIEDSDSD